MCNFQCPVKSRMYEGVCIQRAPTGENVLLDLTDTLVVPEETVCLLNPGHPWQSVVICKNKRWLLPGE